jgi:hypothetical protein
MREMSIEDCDDANTVLDAYRDAIARAQSKADKRARAEAARNAKGGRR